MARISKCCSFTASIPSKRELYLVIQCCRIYKRRQDTHLSNHVSGRTLALHRFFGSQLETIKVRAANDGYLNKRRRGGCFLEESTLVLITLSPFTSHVMDKRP